MYRLFVHQDLARIGLIQSSDQAQQSRLAASGRTQQNAEFTDIAPFSRVRILNFEIDVLEGVNSSNHRPQTNDRLTLLTVILDFFDSIS